MFSHSDPSLLSLMGDIVQDVFLALDMSYNETSPLFCTVLHSLMKALARWFLSSVGEPVRIKEPRRRGVSRTS